MSTVLWSLAVVLAVVFAASGAVKLFVPRAALAQRMPWTVDATDGQVKLLGALELAGATGLLLPGLLGIVPALVPLAAIGLALTMVGAIVTHVRAGEGAAAIPAAVLLVLCLVVAWGRLGPYPL